MDKVCEACNSPRGPSIIDACIAFLPPNCIMADGGLKGVRFACCGHGTYRKRYVSTTTGRIFRGIGAFSQHQEWLKTPEAKMALLCNPIQMGWVRKYRYGRTFCRNCIQPFTECPCRSLKARKINL